MVVAGEVLGDDGHALVPLPSQLQRGGQAEDAGAGSPSAVISRYQGLATSKMHYPSTTICGCALIWVGLVFGSAV